MKKYFIPIFLLGMFLFPAISPAPVGVRTPIYLDTTGNVLNANVIFTNQVLMNIAASNPSNLVRYAEWTNSAGAAFPIVPIAKGGTGVAYTQLTGAWTNTANFNVTLTNNAAAYQVGGFAGSSFTITNLFNNVTNVLVFGSGIVTNNTKL